MANKVMLLVTLALLASLVAADVTGRLWIIYNCTINAMMHTRGLYCYLDCY
jgi:hypothetical protein